MDHHTQNQTSPRDSKSAQRDRRPGSSLPRRPGFSQQRPSNPNAIPIRQWRQEQEKNLHKEVVESRARTKQWESQEGPQPPDPFSSIPLSDFIPFSDTSEDEAKEEEEEAKEERDASGIGVPLIDYQPFSFEPFFPPQLYPFDNGYAREYSGQQTNRSGQLQAQSTKPALFDLAEAVGRTITGVSVELRTLVLADAFTLLRRIAPHSRNIRLPDDETPASIVNWIRELVGDRVEEFRHLRNSSLEGRVMRAAAKYIRELRMAENDDQTTWSPAGKGM